jgi:hypothetical protein
VRLASSVACFARIRRAEWWRCCGYITPNRSWHGSCRLSACRVGAADNPERCCGTRRPKPPLFAGRGSVVRSGLGRFRRSSAVTCCMCQLPARSRAGPMAPPSHAVHQWQLLQTSRHFKFKEGPAWLRRSATGWSAISDPVPLQPRRGVFGDY